MLNKIPRIYWAAALFAIVVSLYIYSNVQRNKDGNDSIRRRSLFSSVQFWSKDTDKYGKPIPVPYSRFAGAESFRSPLSNALIDEIQNVLDQDGMPADVFDGLSTMVSEKDKKKQMEEKEKMQKKIEKQQATNIALTLDSVFHEYYSEDSSKRSLDLDKLWEASPDAGTWDIDENNLEGMKEILAKIEWKRQTIRTKLNQPETRFYYIFDRPESMKASSSKTKVNTEASKFLSDYALLEEYAIALALLEGDIGEALDSLRHIFRIAYLASIIENVGVRVDAATVRLRAFDVMQRVMLDPKFERQHLQYLREMLLAERKNWIPEKTAWFGDRASGIMLYHNISLHGLDNTLEMTELEWLQNSGKIEVFSRGFTKYHEADKIFYLRSMQKILDVCDEPFMKRLEVLNQINKELLTQEDTVDAKGIAMEPFVANIMLKDVERLMQLFARDQSALDRALVGISRSLGQSNTDHYRDPFTDKPYEIRTENSQLRVSATMLPSFVVPIFNRADE